MDVWLEAAMNAYGRQLDDLTFIRHTGGGWYHRRLAIKVKPGDRNVHWTGVWIRQGTERRPVIEAEIDQFCNPVSDLPIPWTADTEQYAMEQRLNEANSGIPPYLQDRNPDHLVELKCSKCGSTIRFAVRQYKGVDATGLCDKCQERPEKLLTVAISASTEGYRQAVQKAIDSLVPFMLKYLDEHPEALERFLSPDEKFDFSVGISLPGGTPE